MKEFAEYSKLQQKLLIINYSLLIKTVGAILIARISKGITHK